MRGPAYHSSRRAEFKRQGLCVRCGKSSCRQGKTDCKDCHQRERRLVEGREANGLCVRCGKDAQPGRRKCAACLEYYRQRYHSACERNGKSSSRRVPRGPQESVR